MRILGVDPGLTRCGLGVIDTGPGRTLQLVDVSVATAAATLPGPERLGRIADVVDSIFDALRPDAVAIEAVFAQHNVRTVMGIAQISGVIMVQARSRNVDVVTYTPSEVKATVTGNGRADKKQVAFMVAKSLGLHDPPSPADAADALAIAITHARKAGAPAMGPGPGERGTAAQQRWAEAEKQARKRS
jgi:crossover junction endodeoxyribonuclease RuvC